MKSDSTETLGIGNIIPFEAQVAEAVANNDFATIDLRKVRNVLAKKSFQLDDAFISEYEGKEPEWGELGWFTFKRTYARRKETFNAETGKYESKRTEEWTEVVRRVVEGNLSMIPEDPVVTKEYGEAMFKAIWNLVWTPPGRGLWISGTEFSKRTGDAYNNCWFVESRPWYYGESNKIFTRHEIDPYEKRVSYPFVFLFDQSMKGGGVGFSAEEHIIDEIPEVNNKVNLYFYLDENHADFPEIKKASEKFGFKLNDYNVDMTLETTDLAVADSREGWGESYAVTIDDHFMYDSEEDRNLLIELSEIREFGSPIKSFGGVASGSLPLVELLHYVNNLLNIRVGQKLTSVDVTDMHNATGKAVVAGNVRRTAEVALGTKNDKKFINMKNYKLTEHVVKAWVENPETKKFEPVLKSVDELVSEGYDRETAEHDHYQAMAQSRHRWASNNSITLDDPRSYDFGFIAPAIEANGEPGIFNRFLAQNFGRIIDGYKAKTDKSTGGNPCMEINLETDEPCNLVELMLPVMHKLGIDPSEVIPMMVHYAKRVTFSSYDWERSAEVIKRNRRFGLSLSGFMDWVLLKFGKGAIEGWKLYRMENWHDQVWLEDDSSYLFMYGNTPPEYDPEKERIEPVYKPELLEEIDRMYKLVVKADIEYSAILTEALGYTVNPSIKRTTVKPSGTVALLPGISPGVHAHYFSYGVRRITVQSNDPLLKMIELANFRTEPSIQTPGAHVIEFPFKAPTADFEDFRSIDEITIEEQFAMQNLLAVYWADNMVSCTITFHENEKPKIKHLLEQYRMRIKSTSLLPYSGHGYKQAPYEPTSKEEWEAYDKSIYMKPEELYHILMDSGQLEDRQMDLAEAVECAGGQCPTK